MKGRRANHRIRLLLAVFALMFAVAIGRAAWVQGVQHNRFAAMAITAMISRSERVHFALATLMSGLFLLYITLLFARLG